jgi:hypothetical protein
MNRRQQYSVGHIMILTTLVALYLRMLTSLTEDLDLRTLTSLTEDHGWRDQIRAWSLIVIASLLSVTASRMFRVGYGLILGSIVIAVTIWSVDFRHSSFATAAEAMEALMACAVSGLIVSALVSAMPWLLVFAARRWGWRKREAEALAKERADRTQRVLSLARQRIATPSSDDLRNNPTIPPDVTGCQGEMT